MPPSRDCVCLTANSKLCFNARREGCSTIQVLHTGLFALHQNHSTLDHLLSIVET